MTLHTLKTTPTLNCNRHTCHITYLLCLLPSPVPCHALFYLQSMSCLPPFYSSMPHCSLFVTPFPALPQSCHNLHTTIGHVYLFTIVCSPASSRGSILTSWLLMPEIVRYVRFYNE